MSFLYYDTATPDVDANFRNIKSDNVYQKNPETGEYERVGSGGGGGGGVPYWVQSGAANIYDNGSRDEAVHNKLGYSVRNVADSQDAKLTKDGIEVNTTSAGTGAELTSTSLTFGDEGGNSSINKISCKNLNEIGARIDKAETVAADKMLIYDTSASMYKTTPWLPYLKPTSVVVSTVNNNYSVAPNGINAVSIGEGKFCGINVTGYSLYSKIGASDPNTDYTKPYTTIESGGANFMNGNGKGGVIVYNAGSILLRPITGNGSDKILTYPVLSDLINFNAKTNAATVSDDKLLFFNPTTSLYKYSDISEVKAKFYSWPTNVNLTVSDESVTKLGTMTTTTLSYTTTQDQVRFNNSLGKIFGITQSLKTGDKVIITFTNSISTNTLAVSADYYFPMRLVMDSISATDSFSVICEPTSVNATVVKRDINYGNLTYYNQPVIVIRPSGGSLELRSIKLTVSLDNKGSTLIPVTLG